MNRRTTVTLSLAAICAVTTASCGDDAEARSVSEEVEEAADAVGDWTEDRWNSFVSTSNEQLDKAKSQLKELREDAKDAGDEAQASWKETEAQLEKRIDELEAQLDDAGESTKDAWNDMSSSVKNAFENLDDAFQVAKKELGK